MISVRLQRMLCNLVLVMFVVAVIALLPRCDAEDRLSDSFVNRDPVEKVSHSATDMGCLAGARLVSCALQTNVVRQQRRFQLKAEAKKEEVAEAKTQIEPGDVIVVSPEWTDERAEVAADAKMMIGKAVHYHRERTIKEEGKPDAAVLETKAAIITGVGPKHNGDCELCVLCSDGVHFVLASYSDTPATNRWNWPRPV